MPSPVGVEVPGPASGVLFWRAGFYSDFEYENEYRFAEYAIRGDEVALRNQGR